VIAKAPSRNSSMKRLLAPLVLAGVALASSPAAAQEIQLRGPLAGARSVARLVQYRQGRFALTPTFGIQMGLSAIHWYISRTFFHKDFNVVVAMAWTFPNYCAGACPSTRGSRAIATSSTTRHKSLRSTLGSLSSRSTWREAV